MKHQWILSVQVPMENPYQHDELVDRVIESVIGEDADIRHAAFGGDDFRDFEFQARPTEYFRILRRLREKGLLVLSHADALARQTSRSPRRHE